MAKLKSEIFKITDAIVKGYHPEKVILYGSFASGTKITPHSDIDLLIIKDTKKNPWERLKEVDRYIDHKVPVDVLVYTPKEITDRLSVEDFFVKNILRRGKVLYAK